MIAPVRMTQKGLSEITLKIRRIAERLAFFVINGWPIGVREEESALGTTKIFCKDL